MRKEGFIPNRSDDVFDSDGSSIHGDLVNVDDVDFSEDESVGSQNGNDPNFVNNDDGSDDEKSSASEDSKEDDENCSSLSSEDDDDDTLNAESEDDRRICDGSLNENEQEDDDNSDAESTASEEASATMGEIFGTKPNPEANRNHPPNFETDSAMLDLCFHPSCNLIAAGSVYGDCIIYRYDNDKVEEVARFSHHMNSCRQVCYSEDGSILYSVSKDKSLAVIDTNNSAIKMHLKDIHEASIYSFVEMDNNMCATGDDDGTVRLWDLRNSNPVAEFKCGEETVSSLLSCEDNKFLSATVCDGSVTGINLKKNRIQCQSEMFSGEFNCQALVRSESRLVIGTGSGTMQIFNWGQFGYVVDSLKGHPEPVNCIVPITDNMVITGCDDGNIRAVHLYAHRFIGIVGQHKDFGVDNLALSHDGEILASCSLDDVIQFWNIEYLYKKKVNDKKRGNKKISSAVNLESSKKRNTREFFDDIPRKMESDDEGGPVPSTSYDSD